MTSKSLMRPMVCTLCVAIMIGVWISFGHTREITDMAGRNVIVPDAIKKVYAPSAYGSYIMYSIDQELLARLIFPLRDEEKKYFQRSAQSLPVIGSLFGQRESGSTETLLKAKPDLIILWSTNKSVVDRKAEEWLKKHDLPYVYVVAESMEDYPEVYRFLGRILGREERTARLADYCQTSLAEARTVLRVIPADRRLKIYYAEEADGLSTECDDSIHVELLKLAGDANVHRCHTGSHMGMEKISFQQVKGYDPDVIVAQEKAFVDNVINDTSWKSIRAVRQGRIYLVPKVPFNWFDRPPSFMRFLGVKWLMRNLYPDEYRIDIVKEAREFYKAFLEINVSEAEMKKILFP